MTVELEPEQPAATSKDRPIPLQAGGVGLVLGPPFPFLLTIPPQLAHTAPMSQFRTLAEVEERHIEETVRHCEGNLTRAARKLGIDRRTLYRKVSKSAGISALVRGFRIKALRA